MKTWIKHIVSISLAVCIGCAATVSVFAKAEPTEKEEVVYFNLDSSGKVDAVYVVNIFDTTPGQTIVDTGSYSQVKNLTTTDTIAIDRSVITVKSKGGKFYYEGALADPENPWDITVAYTLDGKAIDGYVLAGKSGDLQIDLRIHHSKTIHEVYKDNYAVQATITLNTETCKNIVAKDATISNVGNKKQLSYVIMPGKEKDITVTASVNNFEMDGIQINMIPMSMNIDSPNTDEMKGSLEDLKGGVQELDDGAGELDDGASTLLDGVMDLQKGVQELKDGAKDLRDGAFALWDGTAELYRGIDKFDDGMSKLSEGVHAYRMGISGIKSKSPEIVNASTQVLAGLNKLLSGMVAPNTKSIELSVQQAIELKVGSQGYLETLDSLIDQYTHKLDALTGSLGASDSQEVQQLAETVEIYKSLRAEYKQINDGVSAMVDTSIEQAQTMLLLGDALMTLTTEYNKLHTGIIQYTTGVSELHSSFGELSDGFDKVYDKTGDLQDGAKDLKKGAKEMYNGTYDLQDGVGQLSDGTVDLQDGATQLKDGTSKLKDGTTDFRIETQDIDTKIDDEIEKMLDQYRNTEFTPISFVDNANTNVKSVQFVMKTEDISIPQTVQEPVQEEPKLTIWQRFLKLFNLL